jgi:hypothetical protein
LGAHHPEMPRKPAPKPDNPEQFKRFIETAREVEVDESPDALDRALERIIRRGRKRPSKVGDGEDNANG